MKIGIFGGTFDPIHNGHIHLAAKVVFSFNLDKLIFVPSNIPPHKSFSGVSSLDRYNMVQLAIESVDNRFQVSDYEIRSKSISYTYNTLVYFREIYPKDYLYFISGIDIFSTIETWNSYLSLFELSNFIVANRGDMSFFQLQEMLPSELKSKVVSQIGEEKEFGSIIFFSFAPIEISSTMFRSGHHKKIVHPSVYKYIIDNKLYGLGD